MDGFEAAILGLAIGDALGMPVEGLTREQIKSFYGEVRDFLPSPFGDLAAGEWTDDTEQMLVLAESILETVYFDPENFAKKLVEWFTRTQSRRIGPTSRRAIANLLNGAHWSKAGVNSDSCGAAMRVAPIGLVYHFSLNLVERYAEMSAIVTHSNRTAVGGAVGVAIAVACNMLDFGDDEMLKEVVERVAAFDSLLADKIEYAMEIASEDIDFAIEKFGASISTLDVVPMAFYCFFSSRSFEEAIVKAVNSGGDADSIAAICGAIFGAKGAEIPKRWVKNLKDWDLLLEVAGKLRDLHDRIVNITR